MVPMFSRENVSDLGTTDTEGPGQGRSRLSRRTTPLNFQDLRSPEFRGSMSLSARLASKAAMPPGVRLILSSGVPAQVGKSIVGRVAVMVTALHSFGARAHKCF